MFCGIPSHLKQIPDIIMTSDLMNFGIENGCKKSRHNIKDHIFCEILGSFQLVLPLINPPLLLFTVEAEVTRPSSLRRTFLKARISMT